MIDVSHLDDVEVVARTLWAEARNQGAEGMKAVACVIQNRARNPGWWGHDLRSVCLAHQQFSCWNPSDIQARIIRADAIHDQSIPVARSIAWAAFDGELTDITNGADHYCTEAVASRTGWTHGRTPVARVGTHLFYKLGLAG